MLSVLLCIRSCQDAIAKHGIDSQQALSHIEKASRSFTHAVVVSSDQPKMCLSPGAIWFPAAQNTLCDSDHKQGIGIFGVIGCQLPSGQLTCCWWANKSFIVFPSKVTLIGSQDRNLPASTNLPILHCWYRHLAISCRKSVWKWLSNVTFFCQQIEFWSRWGSFTLPRLSNPCWWLHPLPHPSKATLSERGQQAQRQLNWIYQIYCAVDMQTHYIVEICWNALLVRIVRQLC